MTDARRAVRPRPANRGDGRARVLFSFGGNVGDSAATVRQALMAIGEAPDVELVAASRLYQTPPWGKTDQAPFVNACAIALTRLAPEALLDRMKQLETALGRVPTERWGPRVIDIDILAYDDVVLSTDRLTLPHPELFNRAFVLVPLAEIAPDQTILGVRVADAAARFDPKAEGIVPLD